MSLPIPPDGFRLMVKGDRPKKGDKVWSSKCPKWDNTTMRGTYIISEVPQTIPNSDFLIWATKQ